MELNAVDFGCEMEADGFELLVFPATQVGKVTAQELWTILLAATLKPIWYIFAVWLVDLIHMS